MAVYSMTGFASASAGPLHEGETAPIAPLVTVELRSVNSRFLDIAFRLPDELRQIEPGLRELLGAGMRRGKVEVRVALARSADDTLPHPSADQLMRLAHIESTITGWLPKATPLSVNEVMQWCRTGGSTPQAAGLDAHALQAARECIAALKRARAREGARLADTLTERLHQLRGLTAQAAPLIPAVVQRQQQRFLDRWADALQTAGPSTATAAAVSADNARDRALSEAAAYAIRIDVAEELSRLASHLDEIERLLAAGGEVGKRLDFLIQELLREANTLASKAASLELTSIAVEMKVLIEQMREQVQNIE
jgi:uncharacterized protein (TIGR00255 family)